MKATLRLKDGFELSGCTFGAQLAARKGRIVSSAAIPGYQEAITDPANAGLFLAFLSPMVGNYGISLSDNESNGSTAVALVVKELYRGPVGEGRTTLESFMLEHDITGIEDVDTRALNIHLRDYGEMEAVMFTEEHRAEAMAMLQDAAVDDPETSLYDMSMTNPEVDGKKAPSAPKGRIALVDLGAKFSLIERLYGFGYEVKTFTRKASAKEIKAYSPSAIAVSSGGGSPEKETEAIALLKDLEGERIVGIGKGALVLAIADGLSIAKMKKGVHGQLTIRDVETGKIFISEKNLSYAISDLAGAEKVFEEPNSGRCEGFAKGNAIGLLFSPEGGPGPEESYEVLREAIEGGRR